MAVADACTREAAPCQRAITLLQVSPQLLRGPPRRHQASPRVERIVFKNLFCGPFTVGARAMPARMLLCSRFAVAVLAATSLMAWGPFTGAPSLMQSVLARLKTPLETRFAPTCLRPTDQITGVIALGGNPARAREAARIASLYPGAKLIVTGASEPEYAVAQSYGLGPDRYIREPDARSTFENALFSKRLANPKPGERWILVTSAVHMPRAMGVFSALDFHVEPWPVFDSDGPAPGVAPAIQHEILGLVVYRALGRTNQVFPSPMTPNDADGGGAVTAQETHVLSARGG